MSNGLQQRIIGALVLGALGLIILPIIFDFADPLKIDRTSKLPAAPEIKSSMLPRRNVRITLPN